MTSKKTLSPEQQRALIHTLAHRFESNNSRHPGLDWLKVEKRLEAQPEKLWSLHQMEETGGEPDVVLILEEFDGFLFIDCSAESPVGRRSLCYDAEALEARKANRPGSSAVEMAAQMGIELLTEEEYKYLQQLERFDTKTSSWLKTPPEVRALGGAIFGDYRFGRVFVYHNGAQSYYAGRGFRGILRV